MRLNRKTGDRRKRTGRTKQDGTGNEMEGAGRTCDWIATKQETERNWRKTRVGNGQRNGRDGNNERATHEERKLRRRERKCRATGSRRGFENGWLERKR